MTERVEYDEFGLFHENASEYAIPYDGPPAVRREYVALPDGRTMSALVWGTTDEKPRIVFLHGGAQNAHTWDTVLIALKIPAVCIDLPTHGYSDTAAPIDPDLPPFTQEAQDLAHTIRALAPDAEMVVGMSRGGLCTMALMRDHVEVVRRAVLIDVTPGLDKEKTQHIVDFVNGPATFPSFQELLDRTVQFNPTRSVSSLRRGILHNALQLPDGSWVWRHRRQDVSIIERPSRDMFQTMDSLWDAIARYTKPLMLIRGMRSSSVIRDEDEAEFTRRNPRARVVHVPDAGHSVQGDTPLELAELLREFLTA